MYKKSKRQELTQK